MPFQSLLLPSCGPLISNVAYENILYFKLKVSIAFAICLWRACPLTTYYRLLQFRWGCQANLKIMIAKKQL